jgi:hypothetical protein
MRTLKFKRLPNTAVVTQVRHMEIDGMEFTLPADFDFLLADLANGETIRITEDRVKAIFEKAGLITSSTRGSCVATDKLRKYHAKLEAAFYEELPNATPEPEPADPEVGGLLLNLGDDA